MGAVKKAVLLVRISDGQVTHGAAGLATDVDAWLKQFRKDWTGEPFDVHWVSPEDYAAQYAGDVHRVKRQPDGKLHKRDWTYDEKRSKEFPSMQLQLEALWDAMDTGEIPKAKKFYDDIKKIKDKYPKP